METKNLKEIADAIIEANENCLLSGSYALNLMGIVTRREPNDIDIYLPFGEKFVLIDGMKRYHYETDEDYENIYYEHSAYKVDDVKVDVFTPLERSADCPLSDEQCNGCLARHVIIGFKVQHAFGESYNRFKHRDDVMSILLNN